MQSPAGASAGVPEPDAAITGAPHYGIVSPKGYTVYSSKW